MGKALRVEAIENGVYNGRKKEGAQFTIRKRHEFSHRWMQAIGWKPPTPEELKALQAKQRDKPGDRDVSPQPEPVVEADDSESETETEDDDSEDDGEEESETDDVDEASEELVAGMKQFFGISSKYESEDGSISATKEALLAKALRHSKLSVEQWNDLPDEQRKEFFTNAVTDTFNHP